jgi:hypothetical protein
MLHGVPVPGSQSDFEIFENFCEENQKDSAHLR